MVCQKETSGFREVRDPILTQSSGLNAGLMYDVRETSEEFMFKTLY